MFKPPMAGAHSCSVNRMSGAFEQSSNSFLRIVTAVTAQSALMIHSVSSWRRTHESSVLRNP